LEIAKAYPVQAHGRVSRTVRGIFEGYVGWFDGEAAHMYDRPISSIYPDLLNLAGGADLLVKRALAMVQAGEWEKTLPMTNVVLKSVPGREGAFEARLQALRAFIKKTVNTMEYQWLAAAIRQAEEALKRKSY
jgi:alkyl sulfatase BDS1-like metallo-beta-lactamase superfamily hydrolase